MAPDLEAATGPTPLPLSGGRKAVRQGLEPIVLARAIGDRTYGPRMGRALRLTPERAGPDSWAKVSGTQSFGPALDTGQDRIMERRAYENLHLLPGLIADVVSTRPYTGSEWSGHARSGSDVDRTEALRQAMSPESRQAFCECVDALCRAAYEARADWFLKILRAKGDSGRNQLYLWASHWLAGYLHDPEKFRKRFPGRAPASAQQSPMQPHEPPPTLCAGQSLLECIVFGPKHWGEYKRDAWMYGIIVGWGRSLPEIAKKHHWPPDEVARLRKLRAQFVKAFPSTGPSVSERGVF